MKLFFIPFACSLATRIAIDEAGIDGDFIQIVPGQASAEFSAASPMGYVPAITTAEGWSLSEGPAVLQYIADFAHADGVLAPQPYDNKRYELQQWLNFVSTEIHKAVFAPIFDDAAPQGAKDYARSLIGKRFTLLSDRLADRDHLLGDFTVADAYLLAVLNWCEYGGVAIGEWPVLEAYRARLRTRPSVARAMAAEAPLLKAA